GVACGITAGSDRDRKIGVDCRYRLALSIPSRAVKRRQIPANIEGRGGPITFVRDRAIFWNSSQRASAVARVNRGCRRIDVDHNRGGLLTLDDFYDLPIARGVGAQ